MSSQETDHVSPTEVTPELGKRGSFGNGRTNVCSDPWQHYRRAARAFAVYPSRLKARPLRASAG
jgi:hypothetical protein